MHTLLSLLKKDLLLFKHKLLLFLWLLLLPLFFFGIFLYLFSDAVYQKDFMEPFDVMILDKENSKTSELLIGQFQSLRLFKSVHATTFEADILSFTEKGYAACIIIPEKFSAETAIGKNPPLTVLGNPAMPFRAHLTKTVMSSFANLITAGQASINTLYFFSEKLGFTDAQKQALFQKTLYDVMIRTLGRNEVFTPLSFMGIYHADIGSNILASTLALFLGFSGVPLLKTLLEEKRLHITLRFRVAGISPLSSYLSKFFILICMHLLQFTLIYLILTQFLSLSVHLNLIALLGVICFGSFACSGFITCICELSKNHLGADLSVNLSLFIMALSSGCFYPVYRLPEIISFIGSFTPHAFMIHGFLSIFTNSEFNAFLVLFPLFFTGLVFYAIALITTKKESIPK